MSEQLVMRFKGGPLAKKSPIVMERDWPLPDLLPAPNWEGAYRKVDQSTMQFPQPGMLRGADYEWDADWRFDNQSPPA